MLEYRQGVYLVIKQGNKFLLANKNRTEKKEWYFPGGGVEKDESLTETFFREATEELNLQKKDFLTVTNTNIQHSFNWPKHLQEKKGLKGQTKTFIVATLQPNTIIDISNHHELKAIKWVPKEKIIQTLPFEDLKQSTKKLLTYLEDTNLVLMAYIFKQDKLLLTKHKDEDLWLPVGGHKQRGETFRECLDREIKEETNLQATFLHSNLNKNDQPLPFSISQRNNETILEFSAKHKAGTLILNTKELSDYKWIHIQNIKQETIPKPVQKKAKKAYFQTK